MDTMSLLKKTTTFLQGIHTIFLQAVVCFVWYTSFMVSFLKGEKKYDLS